MTDVATATLPLACPYCGHEWQDRPPVTPGREQAVTDVRCVPYTRDVGRFDPTGGDPAHPHGEWSRVGQDFFHVLRYDQHIGILNTHHAQGEDVRYRVSTCPACDHWFDTYVSTRPDGRGFGEFWPHLFTAPGRPRLQRETHPSLLLWFLTTIGLGSPRAGAVVAAVLSLVFATRPWWLGAVTDAPFWPSLAVHVLGGAALAAMFIGYVHIVSVQDGRSTAALRRIFAVRSDDDVVHWQNFTRARFVGYQENAPLPRLSQVDLISGVLSVLVLFATRWWTGSMSPGGTLWMLLDIACWVGCLVLVAVGRRRRRALWYVVGPLLGIAPNLVLVGGHLAGFHGWDRQFAESAESIFWLVAGYAVAVAFHTSLTSIYMVLAGLRQIPLRDDVTPAGSDVSRSRDLLQPVLQFRTYAYRQLAVVFTFLLALGSLVEALRQPMVSAVVPGVADPAGFLWLETWFLVVIGAMLGALSLVSDRQILWLLVPFVALALAVGGGRTFEVPLGGTAVTIDWRIVITVGFLALMFTWFARRAESSVHEILYRRSITTVSSIDEDLLDAYGRLSAQLRGRPMPDDAAAPDLPGTIDALLSYRAILVETGPRPRLTWLGGLAMLGSVLWQPAFELALGLVLG